MILTRSSRLIPKKDIISQFEKDFKGYKDNGEPFYDDEGMVTACFCAFYCVLDYGSLNGQYFGVGRNVGGIFGIPVNHDIGCGGFIEFIIKYPRQMVRGIMKLEQDCLGMSFEYNQAKGDYPEYGMLIFENEEGEGIYSAECDVLTLSGSPIVRHTEHWVGNFNSALKSFGRMRQWMT